MFTLPADTNLSHNPCYLCYLFENVPGISAGGLQLPSGLAATLGQLKQQQEQGTKAQFCLPLGSKAADAAADGTAELTDSKARKQQLANARPPCQLQPGTATTFRGHDSDKLIEAVHVPLQTGQSSLHLAQRQAQQQDACIAVSSYKQDAVKLEWGRRQKRQRRAAAGPSLVGSSAGMLQKAAELGTSALQSKQPLHPRQVLASLPANQEVQLSGDASSAPFEEKGNMTVVHAQCCGSLFPVAQESSMNDCCSKAYHCSC